MEPFWNPAVEVGLFYHHSPLALTDECISSTESSCRSYLSSRSNDACSNGSFHHEEIDRSEHAQNSTAKDGSRSVSHTLLVYLSRDVLMRRALEPE